MSAQEYEKVKRGDCSVKNLTVVDRHPTKDVTTGCVRKLLYNAISYEIFYRIYKDKNILLLILKRVVIYNVSVNYASFTFRKYTNIYVLYNQF
jgi:hypothetical protein